MRGGLWKALELARDSVLAADCCTTLLVSDRLPKQVRTCLSLRRVRRHLSPVYSYMRRSSSQHVSPLPRTSSPRSSGPFFATNSSGHSHAYRRQLSKIFQALSTFLPQVNKLFNAESIAMSDSIIIQGSILPLVPSL